MELQAMKSNVERSQTMHGTPNYGSYHIIGASLSEPHIDHDNGLRAHAE